MAILPRSEDGRAARWRFFRAGGFDQVRLDTGRDVARLAGLDQKLWVALACPTRGIEFDERTLDLIDTDRDGRIRAPEILAAAGWAVALLKDPEDLARGGGILDLAAIDDGTAEGSTLLASARTVLRMLGKPEATAITLHDTGDIERIYAGAPFNGDGVVPVDAAEDAETRAALADIIACIGAETDRGGKPGVSQATADRFFAEAASIAGWWDAAARDPRSILPLGDGTAAAQAALAGLRAKIDDFFTRCRLAAYDPRAVEALNPPLAAFEALGGREVDAGCAEVALLPIGRIEPGGTLPLREGFNPAWAAAVDGFARMVVSPLLGERASLEEADWSTIKQRLLAHAEWLARKPATAVEPLGAERIGHLLAGDGHARIDALLARDKALEPEMSAIARVEKLLRFQRDLLPLLNNFVAFPDFYRRSGKAVFQAGTLYLDGRSCELCVRVVDEAKHAQLATLSRIYLAYCLCTRDGGAEKMTIAAAFTAGDSDNLMVGRNGVFYDRKGRDWDATIVKIVEHPISLRQAFWSPYKQLGRMIGEQTEKMAQARAKSTQEGLAQGLGRIAQPGQTAEPAAKEPTAREQAFDVARFAGIFAAIGLALGALGTAAAALVTGFLSLAWWQMPLAIAGVLLVISGPAVVIAALKLRYRNLGPILDACGWAVNTRLRINIPFGGALTALPHLPEGASRALADPYADKQRPWALYLGLALAILAVALAWRFGFFTALSAY
jgi:hypothetical protein